MAFTIQDALDGARYELNDDDKERYQDAAHLLAFARDGISVMLNMRPDLFIGNLTLDVSAIGVGDALPFDAQYKPALQEYIVHRAQRRDDDYANDGHVAMASQLFEKRLS